MTTKEKFFKLLKDNIDLTAIEQTDLNKYTDKPDYNQKSAEYWQKTINRHIQNNRLLEQFMRTFNMTEG